jgi:hypothetical protein
MGATADVVCDPSDGYGLRRLAAFKADVLTALGHLFVEAILAGYRARAKRHGVEDVQCGALDWLRRVARRLGDEARKGTRWPLLGPVVPGV